MCQATVYLGDQEIAREVIALEQDEATVQIATFFEEPRIVAGRIRRIDLLKNQVFIEPLEGQEDG